MTMPSVLFVAHGSRDPLALGEIEAFVRRYREAHPSQRVGLGYIELASPSLPEALSAIASLGGEVAVVPLFLFTARHVKNDIPLALEAARKAHPGVRFHAIQAFGVHPALGQMAYERAHTVLGPQTAPERARTAVVMLGRGSSDPDANGDFCKLARVFEEGRGFMQVLPAFVGVTTPKLDEAFELLSRRRPARILVVPYLLFTGLLLEKIRAQVSAFGARYPWIRAELAPHLANGPLEALERHIDQRIREGLEGGLPLPCDGCQYRVPLTGLAENVGGLKALLWSIRHQQTHTQAAPHPHAHRALERHVLVCGNADCADRGSLALVDSLRRRLKDAGKGRAVRVTRTSCMGRCGEGPTLVVYPDGIWYRNVQETDAQELVDEHLVSGRLLARLVDNIMQ